MAIRILIADDHSVVRQGLRMFLGLDPELEVVGEARDGAEALRLAHELHPDVVLIDLLMPVMDGITAIGAIRRELPDLEAIALTSVLDDNSVVGAVRAGAIGYLLKDTEADELRRAIKAAAAGQVQLSPKAAARLMREVRAPDSPEALTEREIDVLRLLAQGQANKQIARDLRIGEKTVKTHVSNILAKLGVPSRTQAALYAVRIGLVSTDQLSGEERVEIGDCCANLQSLLATHSVTILKRHEPARRRPSVVGLGADKTVVGQLLANMRHPAGDPAHGERGGKQVERQAQRIQQRRAIELDIWIELAPGEVWVLGNHSPDLVGDRLPVVRVAFRQRLDLPA
jgi:two-component system, NarL family, response regulator LiaR